MRSRIQKMRASMSVNIIGGVILLLILFAVTTYLLGSLTFSRVILDEYSVSTYHMADTATSLVNGDHIEGYLKGEEQWEYRRTKRYLDSYCKKMHVSLVYVIMVDTSDYGRFVSVFNSVNNEVDNSSYTPWEPGYERDTTNEEYRKKYRELYAKEKEYETVYRKNPSDGSHPHITTMVPIKTAVGDVTGILCIQRPISEIERAMRPYRVNIALSMIVLSVISAFLLAAYIRRQFVDPIRKVSAEATRFAKENTKGKELGAISKFEDLYNLARSIDTMEGDMVNYILNLTAVTAEKQRIGTELSLARDIQKDSIPNEFPAFPDRDEFDIYATMTPAKEVGGDFYNFFMIDVDHLAFVIGDVSGKGVPASLFMMVTNILISDRTLMGGTPAEILTYVNDRLCEHNKLDMFVTLWLGILDIPTGDVMFANAGHEDAAVCRNSNAFELYVTRHSLVCGAMPGIRYRDFSVHLDPGDKLFLYTDGVPEAMDRDNKMFTLTKMVESLNAYSDLKPEGILTGVHRDVDLFAGDAPQFDDLTMLCIEMRGKGEQSPLCSA